MGLVGLGLILAYVASDVSSVAPQRGARHARTGLPVFVVALILGWAWDRWRNLPALVMLHWGIDTLPSVASFLKLPAGDH